MCGGILNPWLNYSYSLLLKVKLHTYCDADQYIFVEFTYYHDNWSS